MPYADPAQRRYDYTALSQWLLCQRRWYWYGVRNLVLDTAAPALHFGQAIHAGLEVWFTTHDLDAMLARFQAAMAGAPPDQLRTLAKGELILKGYVRQWPHPEPFKVLANEIEFEVPMPDGSTLVGRVDRVIDWNGRLLIKESKTTSGGVGAAYFKGFSPNLQIDAYCYAVMKRWGRCDGALIDAIQVCKTKEGYARDIQDRTPADLQRFEARYLRIVREMEDAAQRYRGAAEPEARQVYLQNQMMCTYFGECPYRRLCLYENDDLIEGHYKAREVTPMTEKLGDVFLPGGDA